MWAKLKHWYTSFTVRLTPDVKDDFVLHCAQKNNARFSVLPFFNIFTQIFCYFIYLYLYPSTFPERFQINPAQFTALSVFYIAFNILFILLFVRLRLRSDAANYVKASQRTLLAFLIIYITLESVETCMEVESSGNIYRFLGTFFLVAFLPILPRGEKFLLLFLFMLGVEGGLFYLVHNRGFLDTGRFREIIFLVFAACVTVSVLAYNSAVRTFMLQHRLMTANEELRTVNERLKHLTVVDPLTQIANRRAFGQYMALSWRNAYQNGQHLTVVMADIDDFKAYNDTYGHQKGDECLIAVASCIQGFFYRETDMVARYGGEEFIMLMMQDDVENIPPLLEHMRLGVEELRIAHENGATVNFVTISVGFATARPAKGMHYEDLIKQADDALYEAKREGKNRVCAAAPQVPFSAAQKATETGTV